MVKLHYSMCGHFVTTQAGICTAKKRKMMIALSVLEVNCSVEQKMLTVELRLTDTPQERTPAIQRTVFKVLIVSQYAVILCNL